MDTWTAEKSDFVPGLSYCPTTRLILFQAANETNRVIRPFTENCQKIASLPAMDLIHGGPMANELYKQHVLIWMALHDEQTDSWIPHINISWTMNGRYQFHTFNGPAQISHDDALALGKQLAEAWVDKKL